MPKKIVNEEVEKVEEVVEEEEIKKNKPLRTRGPDKKPRNISEEGRIKQLEILKMAREKASQKRRELGYDTSKAKALKFLKEEQKKLEVEEYDNIVKKISKKEEPIIKPKKQIKVVEEQEEEDDEDDDEYEEVIIRKKTNKPKKEEPNLIQQSANEILRNKILQSRQNSYLNILKMTNY